MRSWRGAMESKSSPVGERNSQLEKALLSRARDSVGERSFFEAGEERTKVETEGADERGPAKEMEEIEMEEIEIEEIGDATSPSGGRGPDYVQGRARRCFRAVGRAALRQCVASRDSQPQRSRCLEAGWTELQSPADAPCYDLP